MKKITIFLVAIFLFSCASINYNVTGTKIDEITNYYAELPEYDENHSVFWEYIKNKNEIYNNYINKQSRFSIKHKNKHDKIRNDMDAFFTSEISDSEKRGLKLLCGNEYEKYIKRIITEEDNSLNAYAYPNGVISVSWSLIDVLFEKNQDIQKSILLGILAHEAAHIVLKHHEIHQYRTALIERKNEAWQVAFTALSSATLMAAQMAIADAGAYTTEIGEKFIAVDQTIAQGLYQAYALNTALKHLEYSREQEVEADIVACLFLKWLGDSPQNYITALKTIARVSDLIKDKSLYDTHPSMPFRINTLKKLFPE